MPKQILFQSDFTGGEMSPRLYGNITNEKVRISVKEATNAICQPQGPLSRRAGTQYVAEVKTSSAAVELLDFQLSETVAYILEFGNQYIRFYEQSAQVTSGGPAYEIATPYLTADLADLQVTQLGEVLYLTHSGYAPRTLTRTSSTSWTLSTISFTPPPVLELGLKPAATLTPAATSGTGVNFTASVAPPFLAGDVGRQLINLSGTGKAVIVSITSTTIVVCDIIEAFPSTAAIASQSWLMALSPIGELEVTVGTGKLGERVTIEAEDVGSSATQETFRTGDVGKYLRFAGGLVKITTFTDSGTVNGVVVAALDSLVKTTNWKLEQEIWNSTNGYPRAVGQYQQRLVFGGTTAYPQTIWLSGSGVFDFFAGGADAADSLSLTLVSEDVNRIEWFSATQDLIVGTSASEFSVKSAEGSGLPLTPTSADAKPTSSYGSSSGQQPLKVGPNVIFQQKGGKALRGFNFNFNKNNYIGFDITFWAEHLAAAGIKEIAYAQYPDSLLYVVLDDGTMMVGTYLPDIENPILGWTKWETDGLIENVRTISTSGNDQVWIVVKRTIGGSTKRYVEILDTGNGDSNTDGFLDSFLTLSNPKTITGITKANPAVVTSTSHGLSNGDVVRIRDVAGMTEVNGHTFTIANVAANTFELSGTNSTSYTTYTSGGYAYKQVTTITGLSHLEGKTVGIRLDGAIHPSKVVTSGAVTLNYAGAEAVVGLPYTTTINTLPSIFETSMGQMSGQRVRYAKATLRLYKSVLPTVSDAFKPARSAQDNMDFKVPLFTGNADYGSLGWGDGSLIIETAAPLPLNLQAVFGTIDSGAP